MEAQNHSHSQLTRILLEIAGNTTQSSAYQQIEQLTKKLDVARANIRTLESEKRSLEDKLTSCQQQLRKSHKALEFQARRVLQAKTFKKPPRLAPPEIYGQHPAAYMGKKSGLVTVHDPVVAPDKNVITKTP
ncbi:hypothetical protein GNI_069900 [Gregarina niphandrodes]|uniref:Uncharacterized protein n=1 Tax=Gregarina niphandrodes TaxID=110365 RepID=A0A023B7E3_GRENI|nr:hypothetical protein GNI_069900 [Gregarina niphandrodes]EZG67271.1 hypothetical protein GNI_069900 [Gregarina niphandrodes]|eukprot:XP_011130276.1 hypothetical protein GNI_069900 [Gregarina niphandrodes]